MPESAKPNSSCADLPPELANHPKYGILRELGRGGMGVVYQARHKQMDRQVVIKVINRSLIDNPEVLARFRREVKAASQLSHPNIVTAHDADMVGDLHLLVMEFVPGHNLADVLATKGPLPVTSACNYVRQAARALQHAHERGMVHRDIKPENLMLTPEGQIKVLDFGIAKVVSEQDAGTGLTASNSYVGTPEYSAPEQATDAHSADIRADSYSLGCTLYCLLAGRPPFQEATAMKTLLAHLQKEPPPLPQLRPDVPEDLWRVVARLLAKEPRQRYQRPIEVVQALAPFVRSGSKPESKSGPMPVVGSPEKGTEVAADTHPIQNTMRQVPVQASPTSLPARARESTLRVLAMGTRRWPVLAAVAALLALLGFLAGVGVLLVLLGLWSNGVFSPKTKEDTSVVEKKEGTGAIVVEKKEGAIELENLPADAEVRVDGAKVIVTGGEDSKTARINVRPGRHTIEATKDGFKVIDEEVEIEDGKRRVLTARLVRPSPPPNEKKEDQPQEKVKDKAEEKEEEQPPAPQNAASEESRLVARVKEVAGLDLVRIPAGEFYMGSEKGDAEANDDEKPRHKVRISVPFWLGKNKVTIGQFKRFVGAMDYQTEAEKAKDEWTWRKPGCGDTGFDQTDEHPVVFVTWNDANAYCDWLAKKTGAKARLPREAEWEYSCRARSTTKYYFGDNVSDLGKYAWWSTRPVDTRPCGQKKPNAFGLYDMHGLVWEWCDDGKRTYKHDTEIDPVSAGASPVFRGGSFLSRSQYCRAADRGGGAPSSRYADLGFRVLVWR